VTLEICPGTTEGRWGHWLQQLVFCWNPHH